MTVRAYAGLRLELSGTPSHRSSEGIFRLLRVKWPEPSVYCAFLSKAYSTSTKHSLRMRSAFGFCFLLSYEPSPRT